MRVWDWIKSNKLSFFLLILLLFFLGKNWLPSFIGFQGSLLQPRNTYAPYQSEKFNTGLRAPGIGGAESPSYYGDYAPAPEIKDRLVIKESNLSLLVLNVRDAIDKIINYTSKNGGYMVTSNLDNPGESPSGNITIRIPAQDLSTTLEFLRSVALKVVSENLSGEDVTDQYVDIEARLATLNKTKAKFEEILDKAITIQDILDVQREIINLQSQIDSLKGQRQYLEKSAQMAKITIYLSTDEISLPYSPSETWRPNVLFKLAVRSLVGHLRSLGTVVIWIAVYAVIWVPLLLLIYILNRRIKKQ